MNDERHKEQASLHVLGLLPEQERLAFSAEVSRDVGLRRLVRELRETSCSLALLAQPVAPPPELRARVLASAAAQPVRTEQAERPRLLRFPPLLPWAAAAGFALLAAAFGMRQALLESEAALLRTEARLAELALRESRQHLDAERILAQRRLDDSTRELASVRSGLDAAQQRLAQLTGDPGQPGHVGEAQITTLASLLRDTPQAKAIAVWDPSHQEGLLQTENLPALRPDQHYQLWVVDPQYPNPVDGGVFVVDPASGCARYAFKSRQKVDKVQAFAVTLERKGGVPKAEGPFVLVGK
jgi:anti-sigma-K factor RskA